MAAQKQLSLLLLLALLATSGVAINFFRLWFATNLLRYWLAGLLMLGASVGALVGRFQTGTGWGTWNGIKCGTLGALLAWVFGFGALWVLDVTVGFSVHMVAWKHALFGIAFYASTVIGLLLPLILLQHKM